MNHQMLVELVAGLRSILSAQMVRIVLYGSMARGTADVDSDIDVAVFVNNQAVG